MGFRLRPFLVCVVAIAATAVTRAEEFAIETEVYDDGGKRPSSQNLTIFSEGHVLDFSLLPAGQMTVFDSESERFAMADEKQRVQASLTAEELIRFVAIEQTAAERSKFELIRFAASPKFKTEFDAKTGELRLSSPHWEYRVETMKAADSAEQQHYEAFANWFTQLNALFSPIPPAVRMELNEALATRNLMPQRVLVQIKKNGKVQIRKESRHRLIKDLGDREREMRDQWEQARAIYKMVPFHEYRLAHLPPQSKAK